MGEGWGESGQNHEEGIRWKGVTGVVLRYPKGDRSKAGMLSEAENCRINEDGL